MHVAGGSGALAAAADAQRGEVPERPRWSSASSRCYDPRAHPAGSTRCTSTVTSPRLREPDEDGRRPSKRNSSASPPDSARRARARCAHRAQTERENPSLVGGDLAGGSYELDQQLVFRPAPDARYRTPLRGLYMAGASMHPGGAVHGMSGRGAAQALLLDRSCAVPDYGDCRVAEIRATPQACVDALTEFESLPSWQGAVRSVSVLERDSSGRGVVVEYEVDARVKRVRCGCGRCTTRHLSLGCEYLGGDFRDFSGEWRFLEREFGTRVELDLRLDPGRFVPGPLRAVISQVVMGRALADLKRHLESGG